MSDTCEMSLLIEGEVIEIMKLKAEVHRVPQDVIVNFIKIKPFNCYKFAIVNFIKNEPFKCKKSDEKRNN